MFCFCVINNKKKKKKDCQRNGKWQRRHRSAQHAPSYGLPGQGRCAETNVSDSDIKQRSALLPMFCLSLVMNQLITEGMQWVEDAFTGLEWNGMTLSTDKINTFKR